MPTVRQSADCFESSADSGVTAPASQGHPQTPLMLVRPGISAIEYIVQTARPGEVVHVAEEEYYNPFLWRTYLGVEVLS